MTQGMDMIRVFIIEDQPLIINGLKGIFRGNRDGLKIVGSAEDIKETLKIADSDNIDILLLGNSIPVTETLRNIDILKEQYPGKPIVILTSEESVIWKRKIMSAGVQGCISKSSDKAWINYVLKHVGAGSPYLLYLLKHLMTQLKPDIITA